MPMRASKKAVGSHVGRMIFNSGSKRTIERRLNKANQGDLRKSLQLRGLGEVKNEDIAKVMAGEHRAGWSQHKMRQVVEALQDAGVARTARTASQMVTQASRDAQLETKAGMKRLARERRREANEEEAGPHGAEGVLDRMRGAMGKANKVDTRGAIAHTPSESSVTKSDRKKPFKGGKLELQPKIAIPKKEKDDKENPYRGFQA